MAPPDERPLPARLARAGRRQAVRLTRKAYGRLDRTSRARWVAAAVVLTPVVAAILLLAAVVFVALMLMAVLLTAVLAVVGLAVRRSRRRAS